MPYNVNNADEICTWCRNVIFNEETGKTVDCKLGRKNSGNNSGISCVGCKKFVVKKDVDMPYFLRKEAEHLS